jgi:hypothetical protein
MRSNIPARVETVARYDPYLLDRITESTSEHASEREFWATTFANQAVLRGEYQKHLKLTLEKYHAAFVINPLVKRIADSDSSLSGDVSTAVRIGDVVHNITSGKIKDDFDENIAAVTMIVYIKQFHDMSLSDTEDEPVSDRQILESARYIATRVEDVERILPELKERGAYDRETIDMLLDAPAPSLMEGLL